ncbi:hypothetical protein K501DRAFT_320980 [Backusella circina FSU 941]|nr:hypothetical protein K501DRAFT_320980 [Backusella circina FSU 941]
MASHGVYLFRHIQTKQILVSLKPNMKSKVLNQLGTVHKPPQIRKDLWRPLVALTGFQTPQSAQALSDALLQRSQARQLDLKTSDDHLARPKRLRQVDEKDMIASSIVSLREALESTQKEDSKLTALWEQPQFMELNGEKEWPAYLEHGQLLLKNNRFVREA